MAIYGETSPTRYGYDQELAGFEANLANGQPVDPYEKTLQYFLTTYGAGESGISPQEIEGYVQELYNRYPKANIISTDTNIDYSGSGSGSSGPTQAEINAYNARVNENYQLAVNKANRDREGQLTGFQDNLTDLESQGRGLGSSRDQGYAGNQGYFNMVSPDAYQSQLGNYNKKVLDAYNEGMTTVNRNKERVGQAKTRYEQDYADYLRGLELNRQDQLKTYSPTGSGAFSDFSASQDAQVGALDQVNTAAPATMSAANGIPTIVDANARFGRSSLTQTPDDPYAFLTEALNK